MALLRRSLEQDGSDILNTREAEAKAAAVSAATSVPGLLLSILDTVLGVSMSSGLSQQAWSLFASPTYCFKLMQHCIIYLMEVFTSQEEVIWLKITLTLSFEELLTQQEEAVDNQRKKKTVEKRARKMQQIYGLLISCKNNPHCPFFSNQKKEKNKKKTEEIPRDWKVRNRGNREQ